MKHLGKIAIAFGVLAMLALGCFIFMIYNVNGNIEKKDYLAFLGTILSFISTTFLGIVSIWQSKKVNDTNKKMLSIQNQKFIPILQIDNILVDFTENCTEDKGAIIRNPMAINNEISRSTHKKNYLINIKHIKNKNGSLSKIVIFFSLKNISESIIRKIKIENILINYSEDGEKFTDHIFKLEEKSNYIDDQLLIKDGEIRLSISFFSDNKTLIKWFKNFNTFQIDMLIDIFGLQYEEKIKCDLIGIINDVTYNLKEK